MVGAEVLWGGVALCLLRSAFEKSSIQSNMPLDCVDALFAPVQYQWLEYFTMDADGCYAEPHLSVASDFSPLLGFPCGGPVASWPTFLPPFSFQPDKAFAPFLPGFQPEALQKLVEFDWARLFALQFPTQVSSVPTARPGERYIGTLTQDQRRERVMRFLDKRKRRNFAKKISYHCRKRVADRRIRIKGRFVTSEQAAALQLSSAPSSPNSPASV